MSGNITIGGEDLGTSDPWEAITSLRQERDSLTGRVAELVTEGNELRARLAIIEAREAHRPSVVVHVNGKFGEAELKDFEGKLRNAVRNAHGTR